MKGQFFLIAGIVILLFLFLIKTLKTERLVEKVFTKTSLEIQTFMNMKNQLIKTMIYSYNKNTSEKLINFIQFTRKKLNQKAFELKGIFIEAFYRNATQNEECFLNLTLHNFLGEKIFNLTLNFSNSIHFFSEVPDGSTLHINFQFLTDSDKNYSLIINYSTLKEKKEYWIEIPVEMNKSKAIEFFDLRFMGLVTRIRDEFSKIMEIV